jgi:putative lipoprotein
MTVTTGATAGLMLALMAWQGHAAEQVTGTATCRERIALPPDAVFEATLEDISKADASAEVIGRARVEAPGNPPIQFEIPYDPARIDERHRYAVRARIVVAGKPFFITDQSYPVLTAGQGKEVTLLLRRTGVSQPTAAELENTYWKLVHLGDSPVAAASGQQEPHFILDPQARRVSGSGGCNRMMGGYELNGDRLTFGQMAGTMMACAQGMDTEKVFLQALGQASTFKIADQSLELFDGAGNLVASFEAQTQRP